jgi:putative transposase
MPHSLSRVIIHLVFSTRHRHRILGDEMRDRLHAYMGALVRDCGCEMLRINSVEDHVHIMFGLGRSVTLSTVAMKVNAYSSQWLKSQGPQYRHFRWSTGYAVFSVSYFGIERLGRYIDGQQEHHRRRTSPHELRMLLRQHRVEFKEEDVEG